MSLLHRDCELGEVEIAISTSRSSLESSFHKAVLAAALEHGADDADLYFEHTTATSVGLSDGAVNRASTSVDLGVGVRVVVGDQVGYAYTEDLSPEAMRELGCSSNKSFTVCIGTRTLHVRYTTYPFLLRAGTWFAYDHPEGWLIITIASAHMFGASEGDDKPAATTATRLRADAELQVAVGDELIFEALEAQPGQHPAAPRIRGERAATLEAALQARAAARETRDGAAVAVAA